MEAVVEAAAKAAMKGTTDRSKARKSRTSLRENVRIAGILWEKSRKAVLALAMICVMLGSGLAALAAAPDGWNREGPSLVSWSGTPAEALAKSKKKKNTPTPKVQASPTPKAEAVRETEGAAEEEAGSRAAASVPDVPTPTPVPEGPITDPRSIADWLFSHDMQLPDNFITKKQAQALGWDSRNNYVSDIAPGKSIGGDYFGNYEGILPVGKGISYHEADCYYTKGRRNACRVIYSSDGRVWYTEDHYSSFTELFPTVP